jgi:type II secretion system protein G
MKSNKGFTLIELLVVIAIIGILSSVVLASMNSARKKSRDARRQQDLKGLSTALELFYDQNGYYPQGSGTAGTPGEVDPASGTGPLEVLKTNNFINAIAADPLPTGSYWYATDGTGSASTTYCLGTNMEGTAPQPVDTCAPGGSAIDVTTGLNPANSTDYHVGP